MVDRLKEIRDKIIAWWKKYTSKQRTVIITVAAIVVFAFAIFIYVMSRPQYTRLMNCSNATEASTIMDLLEAAGVNCQLSDDGLRIDVEVNQVSQANRALGAAGYSDKAPSLSDALSGGFSTTESDKQKLYADYKQKDLAILFESFENVKNAEVRLNIPVQDGTLIAKEQETSAYICLELSGTFTQDNAVTMAKAAASSLGNATTASIIISDNEGNLLFAGDEDYTVAGQASSYLELQNQAEGFIKSKVKQALVNTGQFDIVEVASFLNFDYSTYEQTDHTYKAQDGRDEGYKGHESTTASSNTGGTSSVPGTDSNDETGYYLYNNGGSSSESETKDTDYILDESILNKLTPAMVIDYNNSSVTVTARNYNIVKEEVVKKQGLLDGITWDEYKESNSEPLKVTVDEEFYDAVAHATGIDRQKITIVAYRENLFCDKETMQLNWTNILSIAIIVIILGLLAFIILRSMKVKQEVEPEEELSVESLLQSVQSDDVDDIDTETKSETRRMVEKFVDDNPEAAANLLRNWIVDDWG